MGSGLVEARLWPWSRNDGCWASGPQVKASSKMASVGSVKRLGWEMGGIAVGVGQSTSASNRSPSRRTGFKLVGEKVGVSPPIA